MVSVADRPLTLLSGMKQICEYMNRSEATVLKLIRESGFPAVKIGGVWESDRVEIESWRASQIKNGSARRRD